MHSYDYDLGDIPAIYPNQTGWIFRTDGDPIPSICLISPLCEPWTGREPRFRATTEELITFIMADSLDAADRAGISLATIKIEKIHPLNQLKLCAIKKEESDAYELIIPYDIVKNFIDDMIHLKFTSYMEGQNEPLKSMAAIGAFVLLTKRD